MKLNLRHFIMMVFVHSGGGSTESQVKVQIIKDIFTLVKVEVPQ